MKRASPLKRRYTLYSRTIGIKECWCIRCDSFIRAHLGPRDYVIKCRNPRCQARYIVSDVLLEFVGGGKKAPPYDRIAPFFASLHPGKWRSGQPANIFIPASEAPEGLFDDPEEEKA